MKKFGIIILMSIALVGISQIIWPKGYRTELLIANFIGQLFGANIIPLAVGGIALLIGGKKEAFFPAWMIAFCIFGTVSLYQNHRDNTGKKTPKSSYTERTNENEDLVSFSEAQEMNPKDSRWKQLSDAYGFSLGQQASLELIEKTFPDLSRDVDYSRFAFNSSALGESVKGVEIEMSSQLGDKWPEMKEEMTSQIQDLIKERQLTREQAIAFLAEVKLRGKGELPDAIRSALLSANPRFAKNPGLELAEGWKQTFRTKGHPKAKGVDFSISFPVSWSRREGYRPNNIQFFQSGAGHGPIMCNLMIKDIPLPRGYNLTEEELKEFFHPNELKDMIPDGATFVEATSFILEGSPAAMLVSDQIIQRLGLTGEMRMTQFITIHGSAMLFIQFMVAKMPDSTDSLDNLHKKYLPTYRTIANTLVLNDKYK